LPRGSVLTSNYSSKRRAGRGWRFGIGWLKLHILALILAIEGIRAARLVVVLGRPRLGRLMVIVSSALPVHHIEAEVLRLTLCIEGVYGLARVVGWAACLAMPCLATALPPLFIRARLRADRHNAEHQEERGGLHRQRSDAPIACGKPSGIHSTNTHTSVAQRGGGCMQQP
jgi:hypothetical protein